MQGAWRRVFALSVAIVIGVGGPSPTAAAQEDLEVAGQIRGVVPPPRVKVVRDRSQGYERTDLSYDFRRGSIWVKIQPNRDINALLQKHGLKGPAVPLYQAPFNSLERTIGFDRWFRVAVDEGTEKSTVSRLSPRSTPSTGTDFVYLHLEWQFPGSATLTPNDPQFPTYQQAYFDSINLRQAWDVHVGSPQTVQIAVIDSGYLGSHEDGGAWKQGTGYDYLLSQDIAPGTGTEYWNGRICFGVGHGTHVGTIAAGDTNNGLGAAGSGFNSGIMNFRTLANTSGSNCVWAAAQEHRGWAIRTAANRGADVINMSYTFGAYPSGWLDFELESLAYAWSVGALPVAAAGNGGTNIPWYPCAYDYVVCVGAAFLDGTRCTAPSCAEGGSNYGGHVDYSAPGYLIRGAAGNATNLYASGSATSYAAPVFSGVAGLLHAAGKLTPQSKHDTFAATSRPDGWTAWGYIDANAAVRR